MDFPLKATFLAIPLEHEAKWRFQALQEELKDFEDCLRFQNPQSPHLTLYYWDEVMEIELPRIVQTIEKIASKAQPFVMHVDEAGTFGFRGPTFATKRGYYRGRNVATMGKEDRVLFLKLAFSDELARVKKACPWPDDKPFKAHITLARMRHPQRFAVAKKEIMKRLKDCSFDIPVDRMRLYAEVDGRKQTPVQDFIFS